MTLPLPFWKYQSIGNDFPVIRLQDLDVPDRDLPSLAVEMAERRFGVGGDGLLAVGMEGEAVRLRMFNPDGTEDFCGNGLRIAARFAVDQGWVSTTISIHHLDRVVPVTIDGTNIRTTLGEATYEPSRVPHVDLEERFRVQVPLGGVNQLSSSLSTGSTHTILSVDELPSTAEVIARGSLIEHDPAFPERTSVIWTQVLEPGKLRIRIWERGVGETLGCGTGSSAAAADYVRATGYAETVEVRNPGGTVWVSMPQWSGPITLEGEASLLFHGSYEPRSLPPKNHDA